MLCLFPDAVKWENSFKAPLKNVQAINAAAPGLFFPLSTSPLFQVVTFKKISGIDSLQSGIKTVTTRVESTVVCLLLGQVDLQG